MPGYGKRIERNFSGTGARAPDGPVEFLFGDFLDAQFANFVVQLGHVIPLFLGEGRPSHARWTRRHENPFIAYVMRVTIAATGLERVSFCQRLSAASDAVLLLQNKTDDEHD